MNNIYFTNESLSFVLIMFYLYFNCVLKFGYKFKLQCEHDRALT